MLNELIRNRVGFGCVKLSVMPTLSSALHILENAFDCGINYFDTAPLYGSEYSEKIIGKFLHNKRDKIIIATKVGLKGSASYKLTPSIALPLNYLKKTFKQKKKFSINPPALLKYRRLTKEYIKASFENSLKNLQTDYIDNYLLHESLPAFLDDDAFEYLVELKNKGLVSKLGIATSAINYFNIQQPILSPWDIFQYEYATSGSSNELQQKYFSKQHVFYSIFTQAGNIDNNIPYKDKYGYLLANILKSGTNKMVLFSTTSKKNLFENIRALNMHLKS